MPRGITFNCVLGHCGLIFKPSDSTRRRLPASGDAKAETVSEHCAHAGTGDHARTLRGRLEQHATGAIDACDLVGDGGVMARHREEVLLGILDRLLDRHWHLVRLAIANADLLDLISDHDQRGEGEAAATLDDRSDAIDLDDALVELSPVCIRTDATCHQNSRPPSRAPSASALTRP